MAIRTNSPSAAPAQTGSDRSTAKRLASRGVSGGSGPEELDEAGADLLVALLEFLGVGGEELEIGQLGLVRGVLHLGMARVEALAVREHLLHLTAEREVGEEARRVRMGGEA